MHFDHDKESPVGREAEFYQTDTAVTGNMGAPICASSVTHISRNGELENLSAMKKLVLDFDDFHWSSPENCIDTIDSIVSACSNAKLSFFTVAKLQGRPLDQNPDWTARVRSHIEAGNICLGVHGLLHTRKEFKDKTYDEAIRDIREAERHFGRAELPFQKVFKGPHWGINEATYKALSELGYTHVYTHPDYANLSHPAIKNVFSNWNLKDKYRDVAETMTGHGHTHNVCGNGIAQVMHRVIEASQKGCEHRFIHEI